jgi:hypothetical protein
MPGIGLDIDGAIQQAPQSVRQSISAAPGGLAEVKRDNISSHDSPPEQSRFPANLYTHRFSSRAINGYPMALKRSKQAHYRDSMHETSPFPSLHAPFAPVPLS